MQPSQKELHAIGEKIRNLRIQKAWSQEELASRAGIGVNTLGNAEAGRRNISFLTIRKIAAALGVEPNEFTYLLSSSDEQEKTEVVRDNHSYLPVFSERSFFGLGRVTVAVPLRMIPGRGYPVISSEDDRARRLLEEFLSDLSFKAERFQIPPHGDWHPPAGDVIAICGPLNSLVTAEALKSDPFLEFDKESDTGLWTIRCKETRQRFASPMDEMNAPPKPTICGCSDMAYVGRLSFRGRSLLIIAGIHAIGSVGAVHYLMTNLPELFASVGTRRFSMVVRSEHEGETIIRSELICVPRIHQ